MGRLFQYTFFAFFLLTQTLFAQVSHFLPGELYVRLEKKYSFNSTYLPSDSVLQIFKPYQEKFGIKQVLATFYFSESEELRRTFRVYFNSQSDPALLIRLLESNSQIEYAEQIPQDRFYFTPDDIGPNTNTGKGQWYLYKIKAQQAWDIQQGVSSVVVAVVDDAVQTTHPELMGVCLPGRDVALNTNNPDPPDTLYSHGTHVAGLIAAHTNNSDGIASLAHGVSILPVKITTIGQPQVPAYGYEGIAWATSQKANIINISWGNESASLTAQNVVSNAINAGILVVAAAGNSGNSTVNYPAGYSGVMSVASTTIFDTKSGSSNYGAWIDVSAPGDKIYSTIPYDKYAIKSGTSFASPLVCATAALLLSGNPEMKANEISACILSSADDIDPINTDYRGQLGKGRINAEKALECAKSRFASCELGISQVSSPLRSSCLNHFNPEITVKNLGTDTVFSFSVSCQLNNQFPKTVQYQDTLAPGKEIILSFPEIQAAIGTHLLSFNIAALINGNCNDLYLANNIVNHRFSVLNPLGLPLPFTEDFESNSFNTRNWFVENPGSDYGWEIVGTAGLPSGNKSARLPYYLDIKTGQRDFLTTPTLDFSGYNSISMNFKHAYMSRSASITDSLIVSISTDCGNTWTRLKTFAETGTKTFATVANNGSFFLPQKTADWCGAPGWAGCTTINLTPYKGNPGVRIRFEGYNKNGNNIYIDNINITGTPANIKPVANFTAAGNDTICEGQSVQFTNLSLNQPESLTWYFEGGTPDSSVLPQPSVLYEHSGTYNVRLIARNKSGVDTLTGNSDIHVRPNPEIHVSAEPDSICKGNRSKLIVSGGVSYAWSQHSSLSAFDKDTVFATPNTSTQYNVQVLSADGCTASGSIKVAVYPVPAQPAIQTSSDSCLLIAPVGTNYEWFRNGVLIEDASDVQYQVTQPGNYNVRVYNENGCPAFSQPFKTNCNPAHIIPVNTQLNVWPNPASNKFVVEGIRQGDLINIFSLTGQIVISNHKADANHCEIDIHSLEPGIYLLNLSTENQVKNLKIIKTY